MPKKEKELYKLLRCEGYDAKFAQLCVDCMVDEERIIGEIVGYLEEIYHSRMTQVEGASDGLKNFVSYYIKERLSTMCPSFCDDEYLTTGFNLLMDSDLEKTAFAINGGVYFVIFGNEEDAPNKDRTFHSITDYIIFHDEVEKRIEEAVSGFDWEDEKEKIIGKGTETASMHPYNVAVSWLYKNSPDNAHYGEMNRLVNQYHYGRCIHKELEEYLDKIGVEYEKNT